MNRNQRIAYEILVVPFTVALGVVVLAMALVGAALTWAAEKCRTPVRG